MYICTVLQVVIESDRSAVQYGSLLLKEGEPIKQDIALDVTDNYLYAMTDGKVYKIAPCLLLFLPCDALKCKARYCDRMSSVRLSVRLSVTLVDQVHIDWKSWKLAARTISPTPSLFGAQMSSIYSQGNMGKFGETRGGLGKNGVLKHKSCNISETRKDRGKVTM